MKIIKTIFIILITLIILDKLITLYLEYKSDLINEGYYNIYNYDMNEELIKEINEYKNEEYFINQDDLIPLKQIPLKKYPLLNSIAHSIYKDNGDVIFSLKSDSVSELIFHCFDCNFEDDIDETYLDYGQKRNVMRKNFGSNIVKISDNVYHVYYDPILEF